MSVSAYEYRLYTAATLADDVLCRADTSGARLLRQKLQDQLHALFRRAATFDELAAAELRGLIHGLHLAGGLEEGFYHHYTQRLAAFMCGRLKPAIDQGEPA